MLSLLDEALRKNSQTMSIQYYQLTRSCGLSIVIFLAGMISFSFAQNDNNLQQKDILGKWEVTKMDMDGKKSERGWEDVDENHYNEYYLKPNNKFLYVNSKVDTFRGKYSLKNGNVVVSDFAKDGRPTTKTLIEDYEGKTMIIHLNYGSDMKTYSYFLQRLKTFSH